MINKILDRVRKSLLSSEPVEQDLVGIDLSHDYVRTVQLTKVNKNWSLSKLASKTVVSSDLDPKSLDQEILRLLKLLKLEQKFTTDNAAISLPVSSAIIQVIQIPYIEEAELNIAVENGSLWESSINLPGELSEYSIFWQVVKKDAEKNKISILFVASRVDEIERYCDLVRKAGFDPLIVDIRCFALRNIMKTYSELDQPELSVFLEISGYENYVVFIYQDLPFIYDIFVMDSDVAALKSGGPDLTADVFKRIGAQLRTAVSSFINQSGAPGIESINLVSSLSNFDRIFQAMKEEVVEFRLQKLNPFDRLNIQMQVKSRVESEKNISAMTVATGLATRRLDIFGYFKFVKAVANINLLPDRQEIIEKEQSKSKVTGELNKAAWISAALALMFLGLYAYLVTSFPSNDEIAQIQTQLSTIQQTSTQGKQRYDQAKHWVEDVNKSNEAMLDLAFVKSLPPGVYVVDVIQKRKEQSEIHLKATDPSVIAVLMASMSNTYKNVKLMGVESNPLDVLQTFKISYQVK